MGPYVQTERMGYYKKYAELLIEKGWAYRCFCSEERLAGLHREDPNAKYDRHCLHLSPEEIQAKLDAGEPYVIRQRIPEGTTTFHDVVYGDITVDNADLEDQILLKSDGLPTYNFANVIDDHLMGITHVVRGSEYLSSAPKYNLLYQAFDWEVPTYVHCASVMIDARETDPETGEEREIVRKMSKRHGDPSYEDLVGMGLPLQRHRQLRLPAGLEPQGGAGGAGVLHHARADLRLRHRRHLQEPLRLQSGEAELLQRQLYPRPVPGGVRPPGRALHPLRPPGGHGRRPGRPPGPGPDQHPGRDPGDDRLLRPAAGVQRRAVRQ